MGPESGIYAKTPFHKNGSVWGRMLGAIFVLQTKEHSGLCD